MLENARILVVEDDPSVANVCRDALVGLGATATVAGTIGAAVLAAESMPLDVILSDADLPDGSVDELRTRLRGRTARRTPLVVMSGYDLRAQFAAPDVDAYLQKPFR